MSDHAVLPPRASVAVTMLLKVLFGLAVIFGALWLSTGTAQAAEDDDGGLLSNVVAIVPKLTGTVTETVTQVAEPVVKIARPVVAIVPKVVHAVPVTAAPEPAAKPERTIKTATPDATPIVTAATPPTPTAAPAPALTRAEPAVDVDPPSSPGTPSPAPQDEPALTSSPSAPGGVADLAGGVNGGLGASTLHGEVDDLTPPGRPTFESDTTPD